MKLYHVSESPNINCFVPRAAPERSARAGEHLVWAIGEKLLHNYLLPRDCPRVCFYPVPSSTPEDIAKLMLNSLAEHVVAIESNWFKKAHTTPVYLYELPPETFTLEDEGAAYYVSQDKVKPLSTQEIPIPIENLIERKVELRILPNLWPLRDAVVRSSLQYSCIRMRNAQNRP